MLDEERVVVTLRQLLLADRALVVGFDARHDALLVKDVPALGHLLLLLQRVETDGARVSRPLEDGCTGGEGA